MADLLASGRSSEESISRGGTARTAYRPRQRSPGEGQRGRRLRPRVGAAQTRAAILREAGETCPALGEGEFGVRNAYGHVRHSTHDPHRAHPFHSDPAAAPPAPPMRRLRPMHTRSTAPFPFLALPTP